MNNGSLGELGKAFVELGNLMQDKSSTVSQLAGAAEKCGIRLGIALLPVDVEPAQHSAGGDHE